MDELTASISASIALETHHLASGINEEIKQALHPQYQARVLECNHRKSKGLLLTRNDDPLQQVRTLIAAGDVSGAKAALDLQEPDSEFVLESARLSVLEGDWNEVFSKCSHALELSPAAITQQTAYQVRALAAFELGDFECCLRDTDRVLAMLELFPHSSSAFYAQVLRARAKARLSLQDGMQIFSDLWNRSIKSKSLDRDRLLALLIGELDFSKLRQTNVFDAAMAMHITAASSGESFFEDLGLMEMYLASTGPCKDELQPKLEQAIKKYQRLNQSYRRIVGKNDTSCTTSEMASRLYRGDRRSIPLSRGSGINHLVLFEREISIQLDPFLVCDLSETPKAAKAIEVLSEVPSSRERFFQRTWGISKFVPEKHDGAIRTLLYRIRRRTGIAIHSSEEGIQTLSLHKV